VSEVATDKYPIYVALLKEVGSYCMQMGALLFETPVDYNRIENHIGKITFKAQLPPPDSLFRPVLIRSQGFQMKSMT